MNEKREKSKTNFAPWIETPSSNRSIMSSSLFINNCVAFCDSGFVMEFLNPLKAAFPTADLPISTVLSFSIILVSVLLPSEVIAHTTSNWWPGTVEL